MVLVPSVVAQTARARSFSEGKSVSGGSLQSAQSARPGAGGSAARKSVWLRLPLARLHLLQRI